MGNLFNRYGKDAYGKSVKAMPISQDEVHAKMEKAQAAQDQALLKKPRGMGVKKKGVTEKAVAKPVAKPNKGGRPAKGDLPMTAKERMAASRARKRAQAKAGVV